MIGTIREKITSKKDLVVIVPLTFGRARITISYAGAFQDTCVDDMW